MHNFSSFCSSLGNALFTSCLLTHAAAHHRGWYDTTVCPSCRFEATHSSFTAFIEKNGSCPMCDQEIVLASVRKMEWNPKVSRLT